MLLGADYTLRFNWTRIGSRRSVEGPLETPLRQLRVGALGWGSGSDGNDNKSNTNNIFYQGENLSIPAE